jgi:hypothetical protein
VSGTEGFLFGLAVGFTVWEVVDTIWAAVVSAHRHMIWLERWE